MLSGNKDTMTEMLTGKTGISNAPQQPSKTLDLITNYIQPIANKVPEGIEFIGRIGGSTYTYGTDVIHSFDSLNGYHLVTQYPDTVDLSGNSADVPAVPATVKQSFLSSVISGLLNPFMP
jgi:hypothetical protein